MNAVAFITDFICKDNTSSLDGFYASVIITACFSNILLHYLVWYNVRAVVLVIYYSDCGLHLIQGYPMCALATSQLPPGRLRTSLRVLQGIDVANKPIFCYTRCCTSTEGKGSLCSKGFIMEAQHRHSGASPLLPIATCCQR